MGRRVDARDRVVAAYLAIVAIWVDRQAFNTDNWTQASSRMLENPTVRNRVADTWSAAVRRTSTSRPRSARRCSRVRCNFVERAANDVLSRPRAQAAWEDANRVAHELLVRTQTVESRR